MPGLQHKADPLGEVAYESQGWSPHPWGLVLLGGNRKGTWSSGAVITPRLVFIARILFDLAKQAHIGIS